MLQGSAGGCGGTAGQVPPCHLVVLSFPGEPAAQQLPVPGGSQDGSASVGSALLLLLLSPLGWPQHWKLSYTVSPAPLKHTCLKLQGNGLKKCSWIIKISEAWQDAGSQVKCVCTEQHPCLCLWPEVQPSLKLLLLQLSFFGSDSLNYDALASEWWFLWQTPLC